MRKLKKPPLLDKEARAALKWRAQAKVILLGYDASQSIKHPDPDTQTRLRMEALAKLRAKCLDAIRQEAAESRQKDPTWTIESTLMDVEPSPWTVFAKIGISKADFYQAAESGVSQKPQTGIMARLRGR